MNYLNSIEQKELVAWVDLTTHCNAGCPQCHRTNINGLGKVDWLPLTQWSIDDFKNVFSLDDIKHISKFEICGTWGDPFMAKDIFEILKYIIENSNCTIQINTNGGMRNPEFWKKIGELSLKRMQVIFDIEGITEEMHNHYRRKVSLKKLKENIKAYTDVGGNALAHIIVFKHNENHIMDILNMCYGELGVTSHVIQASNRFHSDGKLEFIDENGQLAILEEVENKNNPLLNKTIAPLRDHEWKRKNL